MLLLIIEALGRIVKLNWMDPQLRKLSPGERYTARYFEICPVVEDPHRFLDATLWEISRKSTFAETIGYALTRQEGHPLPGRRPHRTRQPFRRTQHPSIGF